MATYTSFLNLEKPTTSETFNLLKMNQNWDKIDQGVSSLNSNLNNKIKRITKQVALNASGEWSEWDSDAGYSGYVLISADYDSGWNAVTVIHEKYKFWHIKIAGLVSTTVTVGLVIMKAE